MTDKTEALTRDIKEIGEELNSVEDVAELVENVIGSLANRLEEEQQRAEAAEAKLKENDTVQCPACQEWFEVTAVAEAQLPKWIKECETRWCEAITATQSVPSGRLVCDVEELLHYYNSHKPLPPAPEEGKC